MAMSIDDKLGLNRFHADKSYPHITVNQGFTDVKEIERVVMACPAKLYGYNDGKISFNHETRPGDCVSLYRATGQMEDGLHCFVEGRLGETSAFCVEFVF